MDVKPIAGEARTALASLLAEHGIAAKHIDVIMPHIRMADNRVYLNIRLEDVDLERLDNPAAFTRMISAAPKYLIPIPKNCEAIPTQTILLTSENDRLVESESPAKPGGFVVVNNPSPKAVEAMNSTYESMLIADPKARISAMISDARANGSENIFPAERNFETALKDATLPITEPGLYQVKPSMPRAICRFPGPVIIDQTARWGAKADGSPNYQVQPNSVFIIHLGEDGKPLKQGNFIKANSYELRPFSEDYRTLDGNKLSMEEVANYVPLASLRGDLTTLDKIELAAMGKTLLQFNRQLKNGRAAAASGQEALNITKQLGTGR